MSQQKEFTIQLDSQNEFSFPIGAGTQVVDKPWGAELIWANQSDKYLGKMLIIQAGGQLSTQYHEDKDETVMCIDGYVLLTYWSDKYEDYLIRRLKIGHPFHIPAGMKHKLECGEEEGGVVLEVSTHHPDDIVRLEDKYGRAK